MTNKFSIYELFLMGIAFCTDAEANAFVDMLNKELDERMEKLVEKNMKIDCIFEYGRELDESELVEWLDRHSEDITDWTLAQKYALKVQLYQWREYIPGIIRNKKLDNMAVGIGEVLAFGHYRIKRIGLVTIGELEATDLSKIDFLTTEDIDEIQGELLWWRELKFREEFPGYYASRKKALLDE